MTDAPSASPEEFIQVACSSCGSEMIFNPDTQGLLCPHCGNQQTLPDESDLVQEQKLMDAEHFNRQPKGFDVPTKAYHCNNCGSNTAVAADQVNFTCPFCDSKNVNEGAFAQNMIRPFGILPFRVSKEKALSSFRQWIGKGGLFRPSKLKRLAALEQIKGVYLPFWTYDAFTQSRWTAQAGHYYYTTETYSDNDGNTKTRQVRHTRWVPASGYLEKKFDDVLVVASKGLSQGEVTLLRGFDLAKVNNYDSRFILGYDAEIYQMDVKEGYEIADDSMDSDIKSNIIAQIPGDTYQSLHIRTKKSNHTFKHLLLPVWIAAYQFNNKVYRFVVNGESGKISGSKPFSKVRLAIFIAAIFAALLIVYALTKG